MEWEPPEEYFVAWHAGRGSARLDERIRQRVPALSRERLKEAFAAGRITVDGKAAVPSVQPPFGARIEAAVTIEDAARYQAATKTGKSGFFLLYRDDDVLVVEKEAGVLTVPTDESRLPAGTSTRSARYGSVVMKAGVGQSGEASLVERIATALRLPPRSVLPVHRLDRFTTGVLVLARHATAKQALVEQFARHSVTRRYLALTRGVPDPAAGTFRSRLVSDARRKQRVAKVSEGGELAVTHYEVAEVLGGGRHAVVVAVLETGKRNQIRVHFAEAGWPLVGEHRYGREPDRSMDRQALHAAELEFFHPRHGARVSAASPLPEDMRQFLRRNR